MIGARAWRAERARGSRRRGAGGRYTCLALRQRLGAQVYEPVAVTQAFARLQESWNDFLDGFAQMLVDAPAAVSPETRRKLFAERTHLRNGIAEP